MARQGTTAGTRAAVTCLTDSTCLPIWWVALFGGAIGLVAGSYLATLLARWPESVSASTGRSRCDACGRSLAWFELVPLAAFAVLNGRCRTCRAAIPPVSLLGEGLCGLAGAWFFAAGDPGTALLVWLLVTIALFDALYLWLPDRLVALTAGIALLVPAWQDGMRLPERLAGGLVAFAALWLVAWAFRRVTGREGMGGGDAKLFGALGLWLGPLALAPLMVLSCLFGLLDAAVRHRRAADRPTLLLPLGTYMAAAAILFAILGPAGVPFAWLG